ncbi:hypothetical protein ABEF95_010689 [Exophiala dermatitidis]
MADTSGAERVHPEDRELVEKLAKLQNMYKQIAGLRTLLPEKLINPTRFALENPHGYDPEKLAAFLQGAAQTGSQDVKKFKKDWHSDEVRGLLQTVNTNELPPGADAWAVDYEALLQNSVPKEASAKTPRDALPQQHLPPTQADIGKIIGDFQAKHPGLQVKVYQEGDVLSIDINVAQLDFRVTRDSSSANHRYVLSGHPGTVPSVLRDSIVEAIRSSNATMDLAVLLDTLPAYHDIKSRPCDKCKKLVSNTKLQLPLVRQLNGETPGKQAHFLALHQDCVEDIRD